MKVSPLHYIIMCAIAALLLPSRGKAADDNARVSRVDIARRGDKLVVEMTVDLNPRAIGSNQALLLTPTLVDGNDSLRLRSIGIYGRRRYYQYLRTAPQMLSDREELTYRTSDLPDTLNYQAEVDYQPWMDDARLSLERREYGCCNTLLASSATPIGVYTVPEIPLSLPELIYLTPDARIEKNRSVSGSAFVRFAVGNSVLSETFASNASELAKIKAGIDSLAADPDIQLKAIKLKGFASPEGRYDANAHLAQSRTEALKRYIDALYRFDEQLVTTAYEAEDWAGARQWLEASELPNRDAMLAVIAEEVDPDKRDARLKREFPTDYAVLLKECYPALRHTDYTIAYNVRHYQTLDEMEQVLRTKPGKLSLDELYALAAVRTPGSPEYDELYALAVALYPDDPVANLNAANLALARGDLASADRLLAKAGDSPEAAYTRGVAALMAGEKEHALMYLREAQERGIPQAEALIQKYFAQ